MSGYLGPFCHDNDDPDERDGNPPLLAGDGLVEYLDEEDDPGEDSDGELVMACYHLTGLRLNIDTVRGWTPEEVESARAWLNPYHEAVVEWHGLGGSRPLLRHPKPPAIVAAIAEYSAARKCRNCGCTDYFACDHGCYWTGPDACSMCSDA